MKDTAIDMLLGIAIGDALGVPHEFSSREEMARNPAKDMVGYGTHSQPPGTWSDDASLAFCLAEAMASGYSLEGVARNFVKWRNHSYWAARGEVFDIGITTNKAITRLAHILDGGDPGDLGLLRYGAEEYDNGNGSLMRILPLLFEVKGLDLRSQFDAVWGNSALTHRHIRAAMACMVYLKLAENLVNGLDKVSAYQNTRVGIGQLWGEMGFSEQERTHFGRVVQKDIREASRESIMSGGYVVESLEASLWSFLSTESFKEAVLTAVNFGHDTDTTGAITGGLAGLYYGRGEMPEVWVASLASMEDIFDLGERLDKKYGSSPENRSSLG